MKTMYVKFKEWFDRYSFTDDLIRSLDGWQLCRIEDACWRAYKKGRKSKS